MTKCSRLQLAAVLFATLLAAGPAIGGGGELVAVDSKETSLDATGTTSDTMATSSDAGLGRFQDLPFHVTVSVRGGYDDNVFTSRQNPQESAFTNASIGLSYEFGNARTQLTLATGGGLTYYFDIGSDDDVDLNAYVALNVTHRATPRLSFTANVYASYQVEPDFALGLGLNRRGAGYFITNDRFSLTYLWTPRFSTLTHYTFSALAYDDDDVAFYEDRFENTIGNEFRFLLWPTTTVLAEYRFQVISYDEIERDSTSHFALAGFDHSLNPRFNASFRGGAQFRHYEDFLGLGEADVTEPYFEGTFRYAMGKRTSIAWVNRYGIEEPDVAGSRSRITFRTGLQARHNITPRIAAGLGLYYQHDENEGSNAGIFSTPGFDEESFDLALTVRYAVTRYFAIDAGYNHTEVWSDIFLREYSRNRYFAGASLTF